MSSSSTPADREPESAFFRAWTEWVLRHRWPLLIGLVSFASAAGVAFALLVRIDTSNERLMTVKAPVIAATERLRDDFGQDLRFEVLIEGDVFTPTYLERLEKLHHAIEALRLDLPSLGTRTRHDGSVAPQVLTNTGFEGDAGWNDSTAGSIFQEVTSLVNVRQVRFENGALTLGGLLDTWPRAEELAALRERVLQDPTLVRQVVDSDGRFSVISLRTDFMKDEDFAKLDAALRVLAKEHTSPGFEVEVGGWPAFIAEILSLMTSDMVRLVGLSYLLLIAFLAFVFRHPLGVVGPLLCVGQATIIMLGAMALTGFPLTALTNILPTFILCVCIGDAVHILSAYRDIKRTGVHHHESIVRAVAVTGRPMFLTSLTTAASLASFAAADAQAIQELGLWGALATMVAFLDAIVLIPILLSFAKHAKLGAGSEHSTLLRSVVSRCEALSSTRRRRTVLYVLALGAAVACLALSARVRVSHDPIKWVPADAPARTAIERLDAHMGGAASFALLIAPTKGQTIKDRELLVGLEALEKHMLAFRDPRDGDAVVGNVVSVVDLVRESYRAIEDGDDAAYRIPSTQGGVNDVFTLLQNADRDQVARLMTTDLTKAMMIVRVKWLDSVMYGPLTHHLEDGIRKYVGDRARVEIAGTVPSMYVMGEMVNGSLVRSFVPALIVVSALMIWLLGSFRLGLVSMIPNLLPIAAATGFMGAFDVPVDLGTVINATIALGIVVDNTVHLMHQAKTNYDRTGDMSLSLSRAFARAGSAVILTGFILMSGFSVYLTANLANLHRFGVLIIWTVCVAMVCDLVITPAVLRTFLGAQPGAKRPARE